MKAAVFSDLHLDYSREPNFAIEVADDVDVIVIAGDVTAPVADSVRWAHRMYGSRGKRVVMVAGNHEHYGQVYEDSLGDIPDPDNVFMLENRAVVLDGVRFLGCCLWTDFELYGNPIQAMGAAALFMNDYRMIMSDSSEGRLRRFLPAMTVDIHRASREWLDETLALPFHGPTVVITHTGPHELSVADEYKGDRLTPAFVSDLSDMIQRHEPDVWIHGHTHSNFDYVVPGTKTRVVCNPRGYVRDGFNRRDVENMAFEPTKTIVIG